MPNRYTTVTELNNYIKDILDSDYFLSNVCVLGEISNYKLYPSGHHYFSIKDDNSSLSCVMFKSSASTLKFELSNGIKVLIYGKISSFPRDGKYQLYCNYISLSGDGELQKAFEDLKRKLDSEGLFDSSHKKPIPKFPNKIAIVTSISGAVIKDIIRILSCRWPLTDVVIIPAKVQGEGAANDIINGINLINEKSIADLIIIGRGGGSLEDLYAFNDENLARTIFKSKIPIISAVGHEPDITISDYVADLRASTPSNAAELSVPDFKDILSNLEYFKKMIDPFELLNNKRIEIDRCTDIIINEFNNIISNKKMDLLKLSSSLDELSPLKVLSRGYGLIKKNDVSINSIDNINIDDEIDIILANGMFKSKVTSIGE